MRTLLESAIASNARCYRAFAGARVPYWAHGEEGDTLVIGLHGRVATVAPMWGHCVQSRQTKGTMALSGKRFCVCCGEVWFGIGPQSRSAR
jgi:hypothetical protein